MRSAPEPMNLKLIKINTEFTSPCKTTAFVLSGNLYQHRNNFPSLSDEYFNLNKVNTRLQKETGLINLPKGYEVSC